MPCLGNLARSISAQNRSTVADALINILSKFTPSFCFGDLTSNNLFKAFPPKSFFYMGSIHMIYEYEYSFPTAKIDQLQSAGTQPAHPQAPAPTTDDSSKKDEDSSDESEGDNTEVCCYKHLCINK